MVTVGANSTLSTSMESTRVQYSSNTASTSLTAGQCRTKGTAALIQCNFSNSIGKIFHFLPVVYCN